jgi:methylmalonyl-CoA/ethylmalonyl-CoA epimerase
MASQNSQYVHFRHDAMLCAKRKLAQTIGADMGISAIGPVMQFAFVPKDFDAAVRHWTETMGVGPFYLLENNLLGDGKYLGEPYHCVFSIAIAYWGDVQIELVRQENDAPSIYKGAEGEALHHTCILTPDIEAARKIAADAGATVLVEGKVGADGYVLYVDTGGGPGTIVEILQMASGSEGLFAMIKAASVGWDGSEPLRRLG